MHVGWGDGSVGNSAYLTCLRTGAQLCSNYIVARYGYSCLLPSIGEVGTRGF